MPRGALGRRYPPQRRNPAPAGFGTCAVSWAQPMGRKGQPGLQVGPSPVALPSHGPEAAVMEASSHSRGGPAGQGDRGSPSRCQVALLLPSGPCHLPRMKFQLCHRPGNVRVLRAKASAAGRARRPTSRPRRAESRRGGLPREPRGQWRARRALGWDSPLPAGQHSESL